MDQTFQLLNLPAGLERSRVAKLGKGLIKAGILLESCKVFVMLAAMVGIFSLNAFAQAPTGQLFNGNDTQTAGGIRAFTYWLRNFLFVLGIIFVMWGIINMGWREEPSFWKFFSGFAAWGFAGISALIYTFSQGNNAAFDTGFNESTGG